MQRNAIGFVLTT